MRPASLALQADHWAEIRQQAAAEAPLEACGLLAGKGSSVEKILAMRNAAHSPVRFVLDPREQLEAFDLIEQQGLELVGIYHSHPAGPATPSPTDVDEAAYPVVNVIISPAQGEWQARGFWIERGAVEEIPLVVGK
jgi:[CysO sulfur-carrier protein]-S-L-cysteine hydrolase